MTFIDITYGVCRRFVDDNRSSLDERTYNRIMGMIRNRNFRGLASLVNREDFALLGLPAIRTLRQIEAFFKKNAIFAEPVSCRQNAIDSFKRAERICRITNRRLDYYFAKRDRLDPDLSKWLSRAEAYISRVLGPFDDFLGSLPKLVRFTSGATSTNSRRNSAPHKKVKLRMNCTSPASPYVRALAKFFGYDSMRTRTVVANRVEFVPKNWKTDRTIACEPEGNLPLQLAFDTYVKTKLRRRGVDLSDQSRNQELARRASVDGSLSTIDLSMASDTLAFNCVAWLLPLPWFRYLNAVRSKFGRLEGSLIEYAKFSSMGNGATFVLETLVFASACYAVGSKVNSVYGDDIIVETEKTQDLLRFLRFLGFIPNVDKTFTSGPFRESCGVDSYRGVNVTPFYLRGWSGLKAQICHNVNGFVRVGSPSSSLWSFCAELVQKFNLPLVPENDDSMSGIHVNVNYAYSKKLIRRRRSILYFRAYKPRSRTYVVSDSRTLFLWHLDRYRIRDINASEVMMRSRVPAFDHKYVRRWVHWIPPVVGAYDHLYWWSYETLSTDKNRS
jgi:hypothetical protein